VDRLGTPGDAGHRERLHAVLLTEQIRAVPAAPGTAAGIRGPASAGGGRQRTVLIDRSA
jgi:hypothetical protein